MPGRFSTHRIVERQGWLLRAKVVVQLVGLLGAMALASHAQNSSPAKEVSEEPDFAFVSGSAYTQGKNSLQFIHQIAFGTRRFLEPDGARRNEDEFLWFQRLEYGLTDKWELDFTLPVGGSRTRRNGRTVTSDYAVADGLVGIRHQFLNEGKSPLTLAMGPQIIFPSGSVNRATGHGSPGVAWDLAVSKDWRGPMFAYATANYHASPAAADPTPGSTHRFALQGVNWATALGIQALEHRRGGSKHDVHLYFEAGGAWDQQVEPGDVKGERKGRLSCVVSPGVRYGFQTSRKTLVEIGVAAPVGLGPNGPKRSIAIQFQYEVYFTPPRDH